MRNELQDRHGKTTVKKKKTFSTIKLDFNPLTPELIPSAQRCLTRIFTGILLLEPRMSLIYA
jgi:hypothetical protein